MRLHFIKNGDNHEGEISEEIFSSKIFPILIDHLIPVDKKQLYTLEQAERELKLMGRISIKKKRWFNW